MQYSGLVSQSFSARVVGVSFCEGYPQSILALRDHMTLGENAPIRLMRDRDNPYDLNAVNVICVAAGGRIGRLDKKLAPHIAGRLDAGEHWDGAVTTIMVNEDHPEKPGIIIQCWPSGESLVGKPGRPHL
jgi:hypothetical protein